MFKKNSNPPLKAAAPSSLSSPTCFEWVGCCRHPPASSEQQTSNKTFASGNKYQNSHSSDLSCSRYNFYVFFSASTRTSVATIRFHYRPKLKLKRSFVGMTLISHLSCFHSSLQYTQWEARDLDKRWRRGIVAMNFFFNYDHFRTFKKLNVEVRMNVNKLHNATSSSWIVSEICAENLWIEKISSSHCWLSFSTFSHYKWTFL